MGVAGWRAVFLVGKTMSSGGEGWGPPSWTWPNSLICLLHLCRELELSPLSPAPERKGLRLYHAYLGLALVLPDSRVVLPTCLNISPSQVCSPEGGQGKAQRGWATLPSASGALAMGIVGPAGPLLPLLPPHPLANGHQGLLLPSKPYPASGRAQGGSGCQLGAWTEPFSKEKDKKLKKN